MELLGRSEWWWEWELYCVVVVVVMVRAVVRAPRRGAFTREREESGAEVMSKGKGDVWAVGSFC